MALLMGGALSMLGVVAGLYVSVLIHDHRVGDLSADQYVAMHQMRDKTFRRVMPVVGLTTLALVIASALFAVGAGLPRLLAWTAVALLVVDILLTVARQLPLNAGIQSWTTTNIPSDWSAMRDRWAAQHSIRMLLGLAAYVLLLTAALSAPLQGPG